MKNTGENFDLNDDNKILQINAPKDRVGGPYTVVFKNIKERWAIVALKWDGQPRLGIRWFGGNSGIPSGFGHGEWFIIPTSISKNILCGLPIDHALSCRIEEFLSGKIEGDDLRRTLYIPNENEINLISRLIDKFKRHGYHRTDLPSIYISSETPPIFVNYPELEYGIKRRERDIEEHLMDWREPETISIEELLGVYQPGHQRIIIYDRGIKWWCNKHNFLAAERLLEEWLFAVVLIHEISHWITHLLPKAGVTIWPTDIYIKTERDVHEGWAQLMTWWIAEEVDGMFKDVFEELNKRQSSPYLVFKRFKKEPINKVIPSLGKLRALVKPANLQDWIDAIM